MTLTQMSGMVAFVLIILIGLRSNWDVLTLILAVVMFLTGMFCGIAYQMYDKKPRK